MLTTKGKNILAKYLVNQAPGYAGYIAIGCGANPVQSIFQYLSSIQTASIGEFNYTEVATTTPHGLNAGDKIYINGNAQINGAYTVLSNPAPSSTTFGIDLLDLSPTPTVVDVTVSRTFIDQASLNFEMFRVPIISRGIVNEDNLTKVVFTAELPNIEQYGMTEIGVYPSGSNPTASTIDSKTLFTFSDTENWEYHSDVVEKPVSQVAGAGASNAAISINSNYNFVFINSYDPMFDNYSRMITKEQPRFESKTLLLRGNTSAFNKESEVWSVYSNSELPENQSHIHNTNSTFSFDKNSADDQIKLAFSVISEAPSTTYDAELTSLDILVQFADSEILGTGEYANMQISYDRTGLTSGNSNTRYYIATQPLSQLKTSPNFQWSSVNTVKVFVSAFKGAIGTNISASVITNNVATITTSTNHDLAQNDVIVVRARSGYDGLYKITSVPNATSFTYSIISANVGANTTDGGTVRKPLSNYWIALDGLRFENIASATANPLYGLTGYSLLSETSQSSNGASIINYPIVKQTNTNNLVEFKFALDTGGEV